MGSIHTCPACNGNTEYRSFGCIKCCLCKGNGTVLGDVFKQHMDQQAADAQITMGLSGADLQRRVAELEAELARVRERKYYYRVEADGQAAEIGFQTLEELAAYTQQINRPKKSWQEIKEHLDKVLGRKTDEPQPDVVKEG